MLYIGVLTVGFLLAICLKVSSMRKADAVSLVLSSIIKLRLIKIFSTLGILKRPALVEVTGSNGKKLLLEDIFFCTTEEILKLKVREDDVFVATYPKSGTTWMQELAWLICNDADIEAAKKAPLGGRSPFMDIVDIADDNGVKGLQSVETWPTSVCRVIKTHLPYDFLPNELKQGTKGKIIYVARNPKDACVSRFHFHKAFAATSEPGTWNEFFKKFCSGNLAWGSWFEHIVKYWKKHKTNSKQIYFVTYETLQKNLHREVEAISKFLGKNLSDKQVHAIAEHCSFGSMSKNAMTNFSKAPNYDNSVSKFMRKGQVGDWRNHFTINQNVAFDELYQQRMEGSGLKLEFDS